MSLRGAKRGMSSGSDAAIACYIEQSRFRAIASCLAMTCFNIFQLYSTTSFFSVIPMVAVFLLTAAP